MFVLADAGSLLSFGGVDSRSGMLTDILSTFTRFIAGGSEKIVQAEASAAGALLGFQLIKMVARAGFTKASVVDAIGAFMVSAIWFEVATSAVAVTTAFTSWLGSIGSFLSGGLIDGDIMHDPSKLMGLGYQAMSAIWEKGDTFNPLLAFTMAGAYLVVGFVVFLCYMSLGVVIVFVVIDTSLDVILGLTMLPFAVEPRTMFLAARGLFLIIEAGMLLAKTSIAALLSYGFLKAITLQPDPTIRDALNLAAAAFICAKITGQLAVVGKGAKFVYGAIF